MRIVSRRCPVWDFGDALLLILLLLPNPDLPSLLGQGRRVSGAELWIRFPLLTAEKQRILFPSDLWVVLTSQCTLSLSFVFLKEVMDSKLWELFVGTHNISIYKVSFL